MANVVELRVFVGSPEDCEPERQCAREVVELVSGILAGAVGPVRLAYHDWEVDAVMGGSREGERPQDHIIEQILDPADIAVFVFWSRIGSDAGRGEPATVEELDFALNKYRASGRPEVLVFFKEAAVPPLTVDAEQLRGVQELMTRLDSEGGLYQRFAEIPEFRDKLTSALARAVRKLAVPEGVPDTSRPTDNRLVLSLPPDVPGPTDPPQWADAMVMEEVRGFAERETVFDERPLEGRVFAVELLEAPLLLYRDANRHVLQADRRGARYGVYTNGGRNELARYCLREPRVREWAAGVNEAVHQFLRGGSEAEALEIPLDHLPLRWASGGAYPVVHYRDRKWTAFFFRDIPPYGWNIPLGASEQKDSLNDPWTWTAREFQEEFLILAKPPGLRIRRDLSLEPVAYRLPEFSNASDQYWNQREARRFAQRHIDLRSETDRVALTPLGRDPVVYRIVAELGMIVTTVTDHGQALRSDLLVAVNPFELGIETVAVVEFELEDGEYILDGEILEPQGGDCELVRMPVALIAHDYLRRAFFENNYFLERSALESIDTGIPIPQEDIVVFDWDIRRRQAIAVDPDQGRGREAERYRHCIEKVEFGDLFLRTDGKYVQTEIPTIFTPTSAKITSYYFARTNRPSDAAGARNG